MYTEHVLASDGVVPFNYPHLRRVHVRQIPSKHRDKDIGLSEIPALERLAAMLVAPCQISVVSVSYFCNKKKVPAIFVGTLFFSTAVVPALLKIKSITLQTQNATIYKKNVCLENSLLTC